MMQQTNDTIKYYEQRITQILNDKKKTPKTKWVVFDKSDKDLPNHISSALIGYQIIRRLSTASLILFCLSEKRDLPVLISTK